MDSCGEAEAAALVALLCSTSKLDRDQGAAQLARTSPSVLTSVSQQLDTLAEHSNLSWEQKLGYLQGNTCLLSVDTNLSKSDDSLNKLIRFSLDWLELEPEVRVKAAVGDLLETLCRHFGEMVFDSCRGKVSCLIKNHLARNIDPDKDVTAEMGPGGVTGKLMNRAEWKNLAAWKDLEVTLGCLGKMFQGLGEAASSRLDQEVLALVFSCCCHHNRFVRDTGYKVCTVLLAAAGDGAGGAGAELGGEMSGHLAAGLADSWALVRLSATQAAAQFLAGGRGRAQHHAQLLPRLCLNRYYPAGQVTPLTVTIFITSLQSLQKESDWLPSAPGCLCAGRGAGRCWRGSWRPPWPTTARPRPPATSPPGRPPATAWPSWPPSWTRRPWRRTCPPSWVGVTPQIGAAHQCQC